MCDTHIMSDTHIMILTAERKGVCKKRAPLRFTAPLGKQLRCVGGCPLVVGVVMVHHFSSTEKMSLEVLVILRLPLINQGSIPL